MVNPFEKRATEYLRDDEAFLSVVTPEPLETFFRRHAEEDRLYDRLVMVIGTPGSGKTTIARLFQYQTLSALLRSGSSRTHAPLLDSLVRCGAIADARPAVVGTRISLESEYRDIWEFPYPPDLRVGLTNTLLQARAVIGWLRSIEGAGVALGDISVDPKSGADAAVESIGGTDGAAVLERARQVELGIYRVAAALVPPAIEELDQAVLDGYRPFDVIETIQLKTASGRLSLRPLAIFDDAHRLHPDQLEALSRWLVRREVRIARWVLTRLDALTSTDVLLDALVADAGPGIQNSREVTEIRMQSGKDRAGNRRAFRSMATDMSRRYMSQMDILSRRNLLSLSDLLGDEPSGASKTQVAELRRHADVVQRRVGMHPSRREELDSEIGAFLSARDVADDDLRIASLTILMERYGKRTPQRALFEEDPEPSKPLRMDTSILEGARIALLHRYGRSYYYGMEAICDAGTENAEQFLHLAGRLVAQSETQIVRGKSPTLTADRQHRLLVEKAGEIVDGWDFPHHRQVERLGRAIAGECVQKSLEPNAPLGGGATAVGIPLEEFKALPDAFPDLARVLQFGIAYNAFVVVPNHSTKNRMWCLVELGGALLLQNGLTLRRGGFLERSSRDLQRMLVPV